MTKSAKSLLNVGLILFFVLFFSTEARAEIDAPKITKLTAQTAILLTGIAPAGSEVLVYLDGSLIGKTEVSTSTKTEEGLDCRISAVGINHCWASWSFQYNPTQKMADGVHFITATARDKASLTLSSPTEEIRFTINVVPAPTFIAPDEKIFTADSRPLMVGLTKANTLVKIFIDGAFDGATDILKSDSGTANFAYRPSSSLSLGFHKILAIAEDSAGRSSQESIVLSLNIELPMPAPTMLKPVVNMDTSSSRPFIVGLAKNDSKIKIYIDQKYNGEFTVNNHSSGTANFAYKPRAALIRGAHSVYAVAIDKRGKESIRSNIISFSTKNTAIAESAQEERQEIVADINEPEESAEISSASITVSGDSGTIMPSPLETLPQEMKIPEPADQMTKSVDANVVEKQQAIEQGLADKGKAALEKIKSLIGAETGNTPGDRGMVNEGKENQNRLQLSVVLFILFLVGVVAWLLWVNRELVKERRAQNEAEEKSRDNQGDSQDAGQKDRLL